MSGGRFNYYQYHIDDIADNIDDYLNGHELDENGVNKYIQTPYIDDENNSKEYVKKYHHTMPNPRGYSKEVIDEIHNGLTILRKAAIYAQRIDWLLSGDDDEDTFLKRIKEEIEKK